MSGALSMQGHVDGVFRTVDVTFTNTPDRQYVDGISVPGVPVSTIFRNVTIQPLTDDELDLLLRAGQRIIDARKLYINNGNFDALQLSAKVEFLSQEWKLIKADVRPWRKYAKLIVDRIDDQ